MEFLRKNMAAGIVLVLLVCLSGCGKKETAEINVPAVEMAEAPEESGAAQPEKTETEGLEQEMGAVTDLGEEQVIFMLEGVPETQSCTRIRGKDTFSIAYNPEQFEAAADETGLCFQSLTYGMESETPVFLRIQEEAGESAEAVADRYVAESNEECTVEELTVGEGEYPAIWVSYTEGTDAASRTCDIYVLQYGDRIYVVQMDCFLEAYEGLGASQALILSTLRFDEG